MTAQSQPENVRLGEDGESVVLLDQTRLPGRWSTARCGT